MNLTIRLTWLRTLNKLIVWPIVIFYIVRYSRILNSQILFLVTLVAVAAFAYKNNGLIVPQVSGMWIYVGMIGYTTLLGMMQYPMRYVVRDLYYVLPNLTIVALGYWMQKAYRDKSIYATIAFSGFLIAFFNCINFAIHIGEITDMVSIREYMDIDVYEVGIAFTVVFINVILFKNTLISYRFDRLMFVFLTMQILLSFGRAAILDVVIAFVVGSVGYLVYTKNKFIAITRSVRIVVFVLAAVAVVVSVTPKTVLDEFTEKIKNSTEELQSEQSFNSTDAAIGNWRAFEIKMAQNEWKEKNVLVMVLGNGMGKGVHLDYVPYTWKTYEGMVVNNEIPLLHCAYYTILTKGGVFGVFSLIWFICGTLAYALRKKIKNKTDIVIVAAITFIMLAHCYVVNGIVSQGSSIGWGLIIGAVNYSMRYKKRLE